MLVFAEASAGTLETSVKSSCQTLIGLGRSKG